MPGFAAYCTWIALSLAFVPALVARWAYGGLTAGGDAAVFTERVTAARSRVSAVTAAIIAFFVIALDPACAAMGAAVLLLAVACAAHGPRKTLFGETWSLARYIEWRLRIIVGVFGFWLLLALTPVIVAATPPHARTWTTATLLFVLLAWHHFYSKVLLVVLSATPLARADLDPLVTPILERASVPRPTLWRAGAPGGVIANAVALPHPRTGRVLFFDTLLERLAPNEIAAILAHEVAHLEDFHGQRLRRMYIGTTIAIALLVVGSAVLIAITNRYAWAPRALCPLAVVVGLSLRARRMQADETRSDRRAVELCGDAEALISGLTHLHAIHHMPRRLSVESEQNATHPSLARRIRSIREAAASETPRALIEPVVLTSTEAGRLAILGPERFTLVWIDPAAGGVVDDPIRVAKRIEATAYDRLVELRVDTMSDGRAALKARSIDGGVWEMPLQPGEATRAQDALNVVDQLLAVPPVPSHDVARRVVVLVTLVVAYVLKAFAPVLVPGLLAAGRPTRRLLVALASALVVTAFITGADTRFGALRVLALGLLAAAVLWQSYRLAKATAPEPVDAKAARVEALALVIPVLLGIAWIAATSHDLFGVHAVIRDTAWPTASLAALSMYLVASTERARRRAGIVSSVLTAVALFAGSSLFLTHVVRDPLVADAPELVDQFVAVTPVAQHVVEGEFSEVRVTSDGRHFLLSASDYDEEDAAPRSHVIGSFDGEARTVQATAAVLVGNDRVLLLDRGDGGTQLRTEPLGDAAPATWTLKMPGDDAFGMAAMPDGRWQLMNRRRDTFIRTDGRIGTAEISRTTWDVHAEPPEYVTLHRSGAGAVAFGLATQYRMSILPWWLGPRDWDTSTTMLRAHSGDTQRMATSSLGVHCAEAAIDASGYVCVAFDGRLSRFWRYDGDSGRLEIVGRTRGFIYPGAQETGSRLGAMREGSVALIDLDGRRLTSFVFRDEPAGIAGYDFAGEFLSVARVEGDRTSVALYRVPEAPRALGTFAKQRPGFRRPELYSSGAINTR